MTIPHNYHNNPFICSEKYLLQENRLVGNPLAKSRMTLHIPVTSADGDNFLNLIYFFSLHEKEIFHFCLDIDVLKCFICQEDRRVRF